MDTFKQVIIVRSDLRLSKGKVATQVAHASVEAVLVSEHDIIEKWHKQGMTKIVVEVSGKRELENLIVTASKIGLVAVIVEDDGLTELTAKTVTCGAIGPNISTEIDQITKNLKLFH